MKCGNIMKYYDFLNLQEMIMFIYLNVEIQRDVGKYFNKNMMHN